MLFANQYVRKFHKISKIKNFKVQNFSKKIQNYTKISSNLIFFQKIQSFQKIKKLSNDKIFKKFQKFQSFHKISKLE